MADRMLAPVDPGFVRDPGMATRAEDHTFSSPGRRVPARAGAEVRAALLLREQDIYAERTGVPHPELVLASGLGGPADKR